MSPRHVPNTPVLAVIETHPIQYHAPVWRRLAEHHGVRVVVIYGSDHSVRGYRDAEFGVSFAWDVDLLSGYESRFLRRSPAGVSQPAAGVGAARGLGRALRQARPDAVLLVGYSPGFHQVAWAHALRSGVPLIFRGETTDHAERRSALKRAARDRVLRGAYTRCAQVCYVGQRSRAHYERLGVGPGKLTFSPHCIDDEPFQTGEGDRGRLRSSTRVELGVPEDCRVALFSGKLVAKKDPGIVLGALDALADRLACRVGAVFLGDGELRADLERQAARTHGVLTRFVGFRNQREVSPYFHAADVLVLPSRHSETWGLVVNEALVHGLPCVVSDAVGCTPDLVESGVTGEIFPAGDPAGCADALARAFSWAHGPAARADCRAKVAGYGVPAAAAGIAHALERCPGWPPRTSATADDGE